MNKKGGDKSHRQSVRNKQHKGFSVCRVDLFLDDADFAYFVSLFITMHFAAVDKQDFSVLAGIFQYFLKRGACGVIELVSLDNCHAVLVVRLDHAYLLVFFDSDVVDIVGFVQHREAVISMHARYLDLFAFDIEFETVLGTQNRYIVAVAIGNKLAFANRQTVQIDI